MKKTTFFQRAGLLVTALLCLGWADSWEAIHRAAARVKTVQTAFVQEKHMPFLLKPLVSEGVLVFAAPDKLRWEYRRPVQSILLMDGERLRRFVAGEDGFTEDAGVQVAAFQVVLDEITGWFTGRFSDNPFFDAALKPGNTILLTPKDPAVAGMIRGIEIVLSKTPGAIDSVTVDEGEDTFTKIRFENTVLNASVPADIFKKIS